ncbi:hypothetical protein ONZ45_g8661 [Pleurotus djamor]|nr:hypothetical protein ONZ45_g8661 [Pleurotus djamor]
MDSAQSSAFSSQGEDVITRKIVFEGTDTPQLDPNTPDFDTYYDIEWTAEQIRAGEFKRVTYASMNSDEDTLKSSLKVALQFPDHLLPHSVPIFRSLKSRVPAGQDIYILADTSYGSCCVDEVAAQHVDADLIVHYGHACMSHPCRLPVLFVFGQEELDVVDCVQRLLDATNALPTDYGVITLSHDVAYTHRGDELSSALREAGVQVSYKPIPRRLAPTATTLESQHESGSTSTPRTMFYIGSESLHLTNILMTNSSATVLRYDPLLKSVTRESTRTNRMLMRRYAAVQKARDADVIGILVGTLGIASYLPLIAHLRDSIKKAHKKSYTISVGKLNPAKLANFMEIECFEFFRPIVTPYELKVSFQAEPEWTGAYLLDFDRVLSISNGDDSGINEEENDQPLFSLTTGKYRHAKRYGDNTNPSEADSTSVVLRNQDNALAQLSDSAAANVRTKDWKFASVKMPLEF